MRLANTESARELYGNCGLLPGWKELKVLNDGYIRLKTATGVCFWALIIERRANNRFLVRLDDSTPELPRGDITSCGTANIFGIV